MDYLLKSSAIIVIFYVCYRLFLQRETFFAGNRFFMLSGLIVSVFLPFVVIPIYVEVVSLPIEFTVLNHEIISTTIPMEQSFDFLQLIPWIYFVGLSFFLGKFGMELISLNRLIKKLSFYKTKSFTYIKTTNEMAPFSFFKWIIYNPNQFNTNELELTLTHEKIHVKQGHSFDILFVQLACAFFWFNPVVWFYKRAMQQNLEFIADEATQTNLNCEKSYQNLPLKTSISNQDLSVINTFYNSLIKKRIIMLHTSKSKKMNAVKYALVLPILVLFLFNFNTELVAQTKEVESQKTKTAQNVLKYVITKNTKDNQLQSIKANLAKNNAIVTFENLKRNERHEIIDIKINYEHEGKSGAFFRKSENPIEDIAILFNVNENELSIREAKENLSQSFDIVKEDGETKLKKEENETNVVLRLTDDDSKTDVIVVVGKDGQKHEVKTEKKTYMLKSDATKDSQKNEDSIYIRKNKNDTIWIKKDVKNIIWMNDDGEEVKIIPVEKGNDNYKIFSYDNENPLILLNGKEITKKELEAVDPGTFENINVLKGNKAIEKYGKKAKDGAIIITTKKDSAFDLKSKKEPWAVGEVSNVTTNDDSGKKLSSTYFISKITGDSQLESYKESLKKESVDVDFLKIKRNKNDEITRIEIVMKNNKGKQTKAKYENNNGIGKISFGIQNGEIFVGSE